MVLLLQLELVVLVVVTPDDGFFRAFSVPTEKLLRAYIQVCQDARFMR